MKNNNSISHNFEIKKTEFIKEVDSEVTVYNHTKTNCTLIYLSNSDNDKAFNIGFKTPPNDDTGVAHIIEHSVFCGSKKFPVKEPFLEIMKGSLNTFLNAMTYKDKTMYPFSSQNKEDYMNILDIYLDAVFNPSIDKIKEIFMQEGWHYELHDKNDSLSINGVVYNEMKGSFSSPTTQLINTVYSTLFDNVYKYVSGGDPKYIPDLTYEQFLDFYNKYYHPSNCCICIYGNIEVEPILQFIDENYLCNYSDKPNIVMYAPNFAFDGLKNVEKPYPIDENDDENNKAYISNSYVMSASTNDENTLICRILSDILVNSDASPIKRSLLESHLCGDVYCTYDTSVLQPIFSIVVGNTNKEHRDEIEKIINDTLSNLVENGIDKKLIEACISINEFGLREIGASGVSKGLLSIISLVTRWAYSDNYNNLLDCLKYEKYLDTAKNFMNTKGFENFILNNIINNNHKAVVTLYPQKGLAKKEQELFENKMSEIKGKLSDDEINQIITENKSLDKRQNTPDTEEHLNTIPLLNLDDVSKQSIDYSIDEIYINDIKTLYYKTYTGGIVYINLMFDVSNLNDDDLCYLGLLSNILGSVDTKNYSFEDLSNETLIQTGGIYFNTAAYSDVQDTSKVYNYIEVNVKAVKDKLSNALNLVNEILTNSNLNNKKRILEILKNIYSDAQILTMSSGHQLAISRLCSKFSGSMNFREKTGSYTFYNKMKSLLDNFDKDSDTICKKLSTLASKLFFKENLTIGSCCGEEDKSLMIGKIAEFTFDINSGKNISNNANTAFSLNEKTNEGYLTPSNVQYVAQGYNFKELGFEYNGYLEVLKTILSTDYLWNSIRIKGGAYGAMVTLSPSGVLAFVSYRDPNLVKTLDSYKGIPEFIKSFDVNEREMTKFILGTIQVLDQPLAPKQAMRTAIVNYITHNTKANYQKIRDEILSSNSQHIRDNYDLVKGVLDENLYVVFGNSEVIKSNKQLFTTIENSLQ